MCSSKANYLRNNDLQTASTITRGCIIFSRIIAFRRKIGKRRKAFDGGTTLSEYSCNPCKNRKRKIFGFAIIERCLLRIVKRRRIVDENRMKMDWKSNFISCILRANYHNNYQGEILSIEILLLSRIEFNWKSTHKSSGLVKAIRQPIKLPMSRLFVDVLCSWKRSKTNSPREFTGRLLTYSTKYPWSSMTPLPCPRYTLDTR